MITKASDQQSLHVTHISDIHYGLRVTKTNSVPASTHYFVKKSRGREKPEPRRLAALLTQVELTSGKPDLVVISGDLAWSASDDDYGYVRSFLRLLRDERPSSTFVVVPGNHDVDVGKRLGKPKRQSGIEALLREFYGKDFDRVFPFFSWPGAADLSPREKLVSIQKADPSVLVVGVNSAAAIVGLKPKQGPVFVSRRVLEAVTRYLAEHDSEYQICSLRVFVMHHHLLPFVEAPWGDRIDLDAPPPGPDPTTVANSGQLQTWLARNEFDVVLHGHKHMPHGRSDSLWTTHEQQRMRHIAIIGAGTAGVARHELPPGERLCFNRILFSKIGENRWNAEVAVKGIFPDRPGEPIKNLFEYRLELGPRPANRTSEFSSEWMDLCHQAIRDECNHRNPLRNFVSVVSKPTFILPRDTARIKGASTTIDDVSRCFQVLHPEYDNNYGWGISGEVDGRLRDLPRRFAFQHGPRIFGIPGNSSQAIQPIRLALEALDQSDTRGYVSLVGTESDVLSQKHRQPTPALVGLQFVKNGKYLDLVANFRSLELSFWWIVNMYEACLLLEWASKEKNMTPGSITFFAPVADWRSDPRPSFPTRIDDSPLSELADLVITRSDSGVFKLIDLIGEKIEHTNIFDLDAKGLRSLGDLFAMDAAKDSSSVLAEIAKRLSDILRSASSEIERAMMDAGERQARVNKAAELLREAKRQLESALGDRAKIAP